MIFFHDFKVVHIYYLKSCCYFLIIHVANHCTLNCIKIGIANFNFYRCVLIFNWTYIAHIKNYKQVNTVFCLISHFLFPLKLCIQLEKYYHRDCHISWFSFLKFNWIWLLDIFGAKCFKYSILVPWINLQINIIFESEDLL